uniref:Chloride channel protein n=1 Tax=Romanomermis culicivorax TaxID=13658 RepID=A0A915KZY3_ROMCU
MIRQSPPSDADDGEEKSRIKSVSRQVSRFIDDDQVRSDPDKKNNKQKRISGANFGSSSDENENLVKKSRHHVCVEIQEDRKLLSNEDEDQDRTFNSNDVMKKQSSIYRFYQSAKTKGTKSIDTLVSEDSVYLVALGVLMGVFSFAIDFCIVCLRKLHFELFNRAEEINLGLQYFVWVFYTLALVLMSAAICQFVAPQAVGSGIPEMKTILRGVVLKEYLTLKTLVAKFLGLILALGTGLPIGKENESMHSEMLAAACAVGVACTYGAPIGGTVKPFSATNFPYEYPFDPKELFVFALIGLFCGFGGAFFVWLHRKYVKTFLQNPFLKRTLFKCWLTYPVLLVFILASIKCPLGYGHYFAGGLSPRDALSHLFSNFSWFDANATSQNNESLAIMEYWADGRNIFLTLSLYAFNMFWMTAVAITLPIPSGVFIPVFVTGAAFGRIVGETMALFFPDGVRTDGIITKIVPGAYAIVGATAFSGAVTHAISTSVVVVEITGQILYILPTMLAVLIANAVCAKLQPSIYDSIIRLKKLPYIPAIANMSSGIHRVYVHDIMVTNVKFITLESTYSELQDLLIDYPRLKTFPLVDRHSSLILLGSISRTQLVQAMNEQVGEEARRAEAHRRAKEREHCSQQDLQKFAMVKAARSKNVRLAPTSSTAASANEQEAGRKNSRFTIRKVSSHEILTESAVEALKKRRETFGNDTDTGDSLLGGPGVEASSSTYHKFMTTMQAVGNYMNTLPLKFRESLRRHAASNPGPLSQIDLSDEEKAEWEIQCLAEQMKFENIQIDPAPFQLVERTSLYRVHALFWMLGLNRAYVTSLGRLVGVVALRELRTALEKVQPTINCSMENLEPPKRKHNMTKSPTKKNLLTLEKQILNAKKSLDGPASAAAGGQNNHDESPEKKRLFSINPSMCFVPNQSETLQVPRTGKSQK